MSAAWNSSLDTFGLSYAPGQGVSTTLVNSVWGRSSWTAMRMVTAGARARPRTAMVRLPSSVLLSTPNATNLLSYSLAPVGRAYN